MQSVRQSFSISEERNAQSTFYSNMARRRITYFHEPLIVALSQVDELVSFLSRLLDLLLCLLVLHLQHAHTVTQELDVVLDSKRIDIVLLGVVKIATYWFFMRLTSLTVPGIYEFCYCWAAIYCSCIIICCWM